MSAAAATLTIASATFRDIRRRPGILLTALGLAVFLLLVPDVCARAVEESAELGIQVGLSTITLLIILVAGFIGVRAGAAEGDLGAVPEWRAAPLSPIVYVLGRFAGAGAAAAVLLLALLPFLIFATAGALSDAPPDIRIAAFAVLGAFLSAAQFAALGLLFASLTSSQLASVLLLAALVASRTVVPELAARRDVLSMVASVLPDPVRLDLSRELAFHRPVDSAAALLACAAAAFHAAACLVAAAWALARREA